MRLDFGVVVLTAFECAVHAFAPSMRGLGVSQNHALAISLSSTTVARAPKATDTALLEAQESKHDASLSFSHVHLYVDRVEDLDVYKQLERDLLSATESGMHVDGSTDCLDYETCRETWNAVVCADNSCAGQPFVSQGRDVVKQLMTGLGFRVTASTEGAQDLAGSANTRSLLVTSRDPNGVQYVVTAINDEAAADSTNAYYHFDAANLHNFFDAHSGRQGIAVLAFEVTTGSIETIRDRYKKKHPKLMREGGLREYEDGTKILEVCAYYEGDILLSEADVGTVLRFVQRGNGSRQSSSCILPGLEAVDAEFDAASKPAYCDHWVSNVFSRTGFLETLDDTLGFSSKVDFNAGVVAAGEAQIESTVTGNNSKMTTLDKRIVLKDQSQVYLPINNALSEVGHVHGFLKEIGQGIQHIASRVENLPAFVQRCNDCREITGEGFTFLNIPRSYYGVLRESNLCGTVTPEHSRAIIEILKATNVIGADGAVALNLKRDELMRIFDSEMPAEYSEQYNLHKDRIVEIILASRYSNLHSLLGDHLTEESYLRIVRNKILVDVQGDDLLFQIFTSNILQRHAGDEAPFFEFIQRVCSECKDTTGIPLAIKPGCGGFGIRNFLTLFLSIEVNKAMLDVSFAKATNDICRSELAQSMVDTFTEQLNESNPILTEISDAMTLEGTLQLQIDALVAKGDEYGAEALKETQKLAGIDKDAGNKKLKECSAKYMSMMKSLRQQA